MTTAEPSGLGRRGRPTLYRGIQMRSRLEALYAAALDQTGAEWEYEPACFAGPAGQWLPDFRAVRASGRRFYIEVKPAGLYSDDPGVLRGQVDGLLRVMAVAWLSEPDALLSLDLVEARDGDLIVRKLGAIRTRDWVLYPPGVIKGGATFASAEERRST